MQMDQWAERPDLRRRGPPAVEFFRALVDNSTFGMALSRNDRTVAIFNSAFSNMLGLSPEQVRNADLTTLFEAANIAPAGSDPIESLLQGGTERVRFEANKLRPDGTSVWLGVSVWIVFEPATQSRWFVAVLEDITEHNIAEMTLRQLRQDFERGLERKVDDLPFEREPAGEDVCEGIVGKDGGLKSILHSIEEVAMSDATVLLLGETGTGKGMIARVIHNWSPRRRCPFVRADCASLPEALVENELFGHEKGAFTGATAREIGRIELANGGTLFLDEVGDISLGLQSKLLRVLQEREFERLGSTRTIRANFRLIAATNSELMQMVEQGRFRSDLFYRLNVFPIYIPPLRDRREDIPALAWYFLGRYARKTNKHIDHIHAETMESLVRYSWPGNVRELESVIERAVILSRDNALHTLPLEETHLRPRTSSPRTKTLEDVERDHILRTLQHTGWVIGGSYGAAEQLGIRRTTLLHKMRRLGISRPEK